MKSPRFTEPILPPASRERMHLVVGDHVDHGKSTVLGRLLATSGSCQGKLDVAYLSPSSVHRVLSEADLLYR